MADLPGTPGVAGPFAGIAGGALIVGGGTNFPDAPPWENGTKTWHDAVYVLPSPDAQWRQGFKLPRRMAYGVSLSTSDGLLCIGGCDEKVNLDTVFLLAWDGEHLTHRAMPVLPGPTSCSAGAIVGSRVYIAGGQPGPDPTSGPSHAHFWTLDLEASTPTWQALPTWPGPERFYAVAGADARSFYLFSGIRRAEDDQGKPYLEYLKDCYQFDTVEQAWRRLGDLPFPNAAVATPAPLIAGGLFLLGRGADGLGVDVPLQQRSPFARGVLRFDLETEQYRSGGELAFGLAATGIANWGDSIVVASGECAPGVRSPAIWRIPHRALANGELKIGEVEGSD